MTDNPPACVDCRHFHPSDGQMRCWHPAVETFDPVDGVGHPTAERTRKGYRGEGGECGWEGKMFEPRPDRSFGCLVAILIVFNVAIAVGRHFGWLG